MNDKNPLWFRIVKRWIRYSRVGKLNEPESKIAALPVLIVHGFCRRKCFYWAKQYLEKHK